jgi:hypothetical protein
VIRKVTVFLSLAAASVGSWVLTRGHAQVSSCNAYTSQFKGTPAGVACTKAASSYMIGVALTMGSLVILTLVLFAMAKHTRTKGWGEALPTIPVNRQHVVGSAAR